MQIEGLAKGPHPALRHPGRSVYNNDHAGNGSGVLAGAFEPPLLKYKIQDEWHLAGYAGDVAALVIGHRFEQLRRKLGMVTRRVSIWMIEYRLFLDLEKTKMVVLTNERFAIVLPTQIDEMMMLAKYLGIIKDMKISFFN